MRPVLLTSSCLLIVAFLTGCAARAPFHSGTLEFALIGDVPYDEFDATNSFPNMIDEMNRAPLAFVVHNGDIKSGSAPCTDEALHAAYLQFQAFQHPLIYLFGDNEWSDCDNVKTNSFPAEERLARLREIFTRGDQSLGRRTLTLRRQSDDPSFAAYRENVRWVLDRVLFAGFNVPGNDNNFGSQEYAGRNRANLAWLKENFRIAAAENHRAIMLIIQANPHFELGRTNRLRAGFNDWLEALERETIAFKKPVVLVHGDSHYFRIDKPLLGSKSRRRIENFTRVETFGNPDCHWLLARVDPNNPNVFTFEPRIVRRNVLRH